MYLFTYFYYLPCFFGNDNFTQALYQQLVLQHKSPYSPVTIT